MKSPAQDRQHPHRHRPTLGRRRHPWDTGSLLSREWGGTDPRGDASRALMSSALWRSRFPGARAHGPPLRRAPSPLARAERGRERGSQRGRPGPAPPGSPLRGRSAGNPLLPRAPPTPPPRSAPLPRPPEGRARSPAGRRPPSPGPRRLNLQRDSRVRVRGWGGGAPARRRPAHSFAPATHRGRQGAARARGAAAAELRPHSLRATPTPPPATPEPTELRRLCLPGLAPARSLDKHFRGSGGRAGFWHRNCSRAGAARPPGRGGASEPGAPRPRPPGSLLTLVAPRSPRAPPATAGTPSFNCSSDCSPPAT